MRMEFCLNCCFVFVKLGIQRELLARNLDGDFWVYIVETKAK